MAPAKRKAPAAPIMGAPKQKMKQGTLFSFFAKKPEKAAAANSTNDGAASAAAADASSSASSAAMTNNNNNAKQQKQQKQKPQAPLDPEIAQVTVGSYIEVYWKDDEAYYKAKVEKQRNESTFFIKYNVDGQTEWVDLTNERFRRVVTSSDNNNNNNKRRRQILQDDDDDDDEKSQEEFEFDDAASEGSVYKQDDDNDDDDEEGDDYQWMASDDEDDNEISNNNKNNNKKKPSKVRKLVVTGHETALSQSTTTAAAAAASTSRPLSSMAAKKTPHKSAGTTLAQRTMTPRQITPPLTAVGGGNQLSQQQSQSQSMLSSPPFTPAASSTTATTTGAVAAVLAPPMYEKGSVNPAGSHVHNHLKFLQQPCDAHGRPTNHPDYDARTLKVNVTEWEKHGKMTDAVKQWWDLKAQYLDTVLLFKTGKFYELFHMDADVGVDVCGLSYMKGHMAHAGFPEISYSTMADKLVLAGYKVARVEQTETPQMLQERKKKCGRGKNSPKVVNREVCSIMTLGTRTFCYLDDQTSILAESANATTTAAIGPLLVIREILLDTSSNDDKMDEDGDVDDDDQVQPVAEYGITVVDAVRGEISIGQFADDCLRSRMGTLLTTFNPSEIILQGGENGASPTLQSLIQSVQQISQHPCRLEVIRQIETFPNSTALDADVRKKMQRKTSQIHPWDVQETLEEIHRRKYYSAASKKQQQQHPQDGNSVSRWPNVLRAAVEGNAELALSSFGAALFYLQRNLIDAEILSMQKVKAYIPPTSSVVADESVDEIRRLAEEQNRQESGIAEEDKEEEGGIVNTGAALSQAIADSTQSVAFNEGDINHLALDGTTVRNLELLYNTADNKVNGSLWSKIDHTVTPSGRRLLRAWLLRPLFRKADIDRRADAVEELASGAAAMSASNARSILSKCGDIERLLSRVHSMSGTSEAVRDDEEGGPRVHPNERAILYEKSTYTKRMVGDFSKVLKGLTQASQVPAQFSAVDIQSELLRKIVRPIEQGGCFPDMASDLDYFFANFDVSKAEKGMFEPNLGVDELYDAACKEIKRIEGNLDNYKNEMCSNFLCPSLQARSTWTYANIQPNSKDKYMIELPASVTVPNDFLLKGKRGSGNKQVNKYRTPVVERLVQELERALDIKSERKARGMESIFAKFDALRDLWGSASHAVSLLDALCSLSMVASKPGYSRPIIVDCPPDAEPSISVVQGRHPCVEGSTPGSSDFVPNDLSLGTASSPERVLLLSGPNMGGKSTLLRQTCLIAILAQIGCSVPAEQCSLTPVDRIFTRLGATDRILMGQSTFFVELAETAAALRGATRRSLVIMDELGRGTSTFDGTALASAAVKHLVERSKCLSLFATHYHSLLTEWKDHSMVRLGHMECLVGNGDDDATSSSAQDEADQDITFLYTLGEGTCPKSFGINVARLAGLPEGVLQKAKRISSDFEQEMNSGAASSKITARTAPAMKKQLYDAINSNDWDKVKEIWQSLQ